MADRIPAGRVGRPHGLDGSFHVTRPRPEFLEEGATVHVGEGTQAVEAEVVRRAGTNDAPILRLSVAGDRSSAEALRGKDLMVPAPPLGEDEYWAADLEGCRVVDGPREVGFVRRMTAYPSCEVLEVDRPDGGELLVPLVKDAVRSVDVQGKLIDVDLAFLGEEA